MATLKKTQEGNVRPEVKQLIDDIPSPPPNYRTITQVYQPPNPLDKTQLLIRYFGQLRDEQKKDLVVFLYDNNIAFELKKPLL